MSARANEDCREGQGVVREGLGNLESNGSSAGKYHCYRTMRPLTGELFGFNGDKMAGCLDRYNATVCPTLEFRNVKIFLFIL